MYKRKPSLQDVVSIGWDYKIDLQLPPFEGDTNQCFFDIHEFKETSEFKIFIERIEDLKIPYEYAKGKNSGRFFLIININNIGSKIYAT